MLLIVGTDGVFKLDLDMLDRTARPPASNGKMRELSADSLSPLWQEHEIEQTVTEAPLAVS